nr:uncharacterized protein LOC109782956 [Aegilops tauschii subsp. strangulata]
MASKQPDMPSDPKETEAQGSFQPTKETKKIALDPAHPERHAIIKLNTADRLKTAFITPFGAFYYLAMTFGLRNMEKHGTLLEDLKETFHNLRRFQIKLNPEKCIFGVPAGQLLGFLVSERGIECNPVKIKAIERMHRPTRLRDV